MIVAKILNFKKSSFRMSSTIPVYSEKESFHKEFYKDYNISSYKDEPQENLNRTEPHRHTYYEIIWIKKGSGVHFIDFKNYRFEGPCLFILNPGVVHNIKKDGPTEGYVAKFSESFLSQIETNSVKIIKNGLFDDIHPRPVFSLNKDQVEILDELMQKMLTEFNRHEEFSRSILVSYLKIFLLRIYELRETEDPRTFNSPRYKVLFDFKNLIEDNFKQQHEIKFYTDQLATSHRNLNHITSEFIGKSAKSLINERLLLEAKRLLYSTQNIKETAYAIGFNDPAYFSRFFKKHQGESPSSSLK